MKKWILFLYFAKQGLMKKRFNEINEKVDRYNDDMLDLPKEIASVNTELMLLTMEESYKVIRSNTSEIEEIGDWIKMMRMEIKKNILKIREQNNMSKAHVYDKQNYKTMKISSWFTLNNEVSQFDCLWQIKNCLHNYELQRKTKRGMKILPSVASACFSSIKWENYC